MKYVAVEENVQNLMQDHGYNTFNPYQFDDWLIENMLRLFIVAKDLSGGHDQQYDRYGQSAKHKQGWVSRLFSRKKPALTDA